MNRPQSQQRPIHPQQLFQKLLHGDYKQIQCEDSQQKFINQRQILIQLISEYEVSIQKQLNHLKHEQQLKYIRANLIQQLSKFKRQRQIIQEQISLELNRVLLKKQQIDDKEKLNMQLTEIRSVNAKLKFKLNDLCDYVQKLEIHNQKLQKQRNIVQVNTLNQLRINEDDWRGKVQSLRRNQQTFENQMKTKMLQKQAQQISNIRRQEQQMAIRNRQKIQQFQLNKMRNRSINQSYKQNQFTSKYQPQRRRFQNFRVI